MNAWKLELGDVDCEITPRGINLTG